jgi:hypothetical protein
LWRPSIHNIYIGIFIKISTCQVKDYFDIMVNMYDNSSVMPQSTLLPRMGGVGNNPGLANNGGQEFHHKTKE